MAAAFIGPALEAGGAGAAAEGLGASGGLGQALKGLNPAQFLGGKSNNAGTGVGALNGLASDLISASSTGNSSRS